VDPVVIRHILKDKFDVYLKPEDTIDRLRDLLGSGIFAINHGPHAADGGKYWALQRKTASKVFTNNNFKTLMFETFSEHSLKVVEAINNKIGPNGSGLVEMQTLMFAYTLDSIGRIGFGVELDTISKGEDVPFARAFDRAQGLSAKRFLSPLWNVWPIGQILYKDERELKGHIETLNAFSYEIIAKRKKEMAGGEGSKGDILSLFLEEKLGLSDSELRDVVMSFMIAGRDTTACTLSFAVMLLATNVEWQERLRAEVKDKLKDRIGDKERILTSNDVSQMKLLQNVVMESLRLYPPVPLDLKYAVVDDVLPGGHLIPAGTAVSYENYVLGRTEAFWGPDAKEFNPDRWARMANLPTPYEFPMFQAGPRICLGESFAKFEAALLLAVLVDKFKFLPPTPEAIYTYTPGITLKLKDGTLRVERIA
jgi:cytochrome P450